MPAASSSLTDPAIGQLLTVAQALDGERARLLPVLAAIPDPRARRGVRHRLAVILGLEATIRQWEADTEEDQGPEQARQPSGAARQPSLDRLAPLA